MGDGSQVRSLIPGIPIYANARHFLRIIDGVSYALYRSTFNAIKAQRGSPQQTVDWRDPDEWIVERLDGEEQRLALRMWQESKHELNPRYLQGVWSLTTRHDLLVQDRSDTLRITERGEGFLAEPEGTVVAEIDGYEGMLNLLKLVADRGPGKRSDFLPGYAEFCHAFTTHRSQNVIKGSLFGSKQDVFVVFDGTKIYSLTTKTSSMAEAATALYPPGSTGTMASVSKVDSAFIVQKKLGIALTAGSFLQSAVLNVVTGAMDWKNVISIKGTFPCDQ